MKKILFIFILILSLQLVCSAQTAEEYFKRGYLKNNQEDPDGAIEDYDKAIPLKPDYTNAWNNKGLTLGKLIRYEEAIKCFDKAIEISPDSADGWYNKGITLGKLSKYVESEIYFLKVTKLKHDYLNG